MARVGYAQTVPQEYRLYPRSFMRPNKDLAQKERMLNIYANRKYSYGFSENFYGFAKNTTIFHAIDGIFSDRLRTFDLGNWASFEATGGASFQPYQGFRIHAGFDYEWLTASRVHFYAGIQYAQGLEQKTIATDSKSWVTVGSHSYFIPFIGGMWWPGKRDVEKIDREDSAERAKLENPTFWQLVFFKGQAGYSALLSRLNVSPSPLFDKPTTNNIRRNVSSGLYLSFGLGINLPSFSNIRLIDFDLLHRLGAAN
jgi:hypothetical protein